MYTRATLPQDWARTHNNLARAALALQDWPTEAASYANVLQLYPEYKAAYQRASWLYHEVLFAFPEAFTLNAQWLERHPDDLSALIEFAEKHLTTGRLAEARRLAGAHHGAAGGFSGDLEF